MLMTCTGKRSGCRPRKEKRPACIVFTPLPNADVPSSRAAFSRSALRDCRCTGICRKAVNTETGTALTGTVRSLAAVLFHALNAPVLQPVNPGDPYFPKAPQAMHAAALSWHLSEKEAADAIRRLFENTIPYQSFFTCSRSITHTCAFPFSSGFEKRIRSPLRLKEGC